MTKRGTKDEIRPGGHPAIASLLLVVVSGLLIFIPCFQKAHGQEATSDSIPAVSDCWNQLKASYSAASLDELINNENPGFDVATASLLISRSLFDESPIKQHLSTIDALTFSIVEKIPDDASLEEQTKQVVGELFKSYSADPSRRRFDPMEGFLPFVLENKSGNCLGLSTLLLSVGQRMELPLFLVQAPTHVFVRFDDGTSSFNIETTDQGSYKPDSYYKKRYRIASGRPFLKNLPLRALAAELLRNRGLAWKMKGEWTRAIADYDRAAALDPESAFVFLNRAYALSMTEAYEKAMKDYDRTIELDPGCALSYLGRGYLWRRLGEHEKAIEDYTHSIEINPRDGQAYANRGYILFLMHEYDEAVADCTRALAINPRNAQALNNRGHGWLVKGEYAKAVADHIRAMELDAGYCTNFTQYTSGPLSERVCYTPEHYAKAIESFTVQIEADPGYATYYYYRGFVRYKLGQYLKALADLTKAIELNPVNRWAFIRRAEVFEHLNQPRKARKDLDHAEALSARRDPSGSRG